MEILGRILDREIKFEVYDTSKNWIADLPKEKWCLVIIAEEENRNYFDEIIRKAIDKNVAYIHSVGKQYDLIHDLADEEIVIREVENLYLPKHVIMTTGDEDFENGIWFGTYITHNEETEITEVIILDVSRNAREKTIELVKKFELGYLPQDL